MSSSAPEEMTVEIRPEVTILSVLRHLNYKAWFAIAEFIDNALQSSIANAEALRVVNGGSYQLRVEIRIDTYGLGAITITDNAAGIAAPDFPRAFRAAQVPNDRTGLSEFGMGMKSAACWFAESWSVRTKALGEVVERTIAFDVEQIIEKQIEALRPTSIPARPEDHYTVVSLRNLHHIPQGRTIQKIKDHLASIYRMYLRDGRLVLKLGPDELKYESPAILKAVEYVSPGIPAQGADSVPIEWKKEIDFDFGQGQRVKGFAALRETGSTSLAGFALFRRNRLVEGSHDETYRPSLIFKQTNSYPYQRLFGELTIEGFEVSHTKDGFRWEEYEELFLDFLKLKLEDAPVDLLTQAENYRALPTRKSIRDRAEVATDRVANYIEQEVPAVLQEGRREDHDDLPPLPLELPPNPAQASERTVEVNDGTWDWKITIRTSVDPAVDQWVNVARSTTGQDGQVRALTLDVSLAHPFSSRFLGANSENIELLLRFATAVCISLVLSQDITGDPPESVLYHFNHLLRGALVRNEVPNGHIDHNP